MKNVKRQRKRIVAVLLCLSIIAAMMPGLPGGIMKAYAASSGITQFATKAQLLSGFGLDTGNTAGKIKFGASGREWLIAGREDIDTIVLFSASSFGQSIYDDSLSTYGDNNNSSLTSTVKTFLSNHENTTYFSNSELALMENTMVSTSDFTLVSHNVTGKLYLPDAASQNSNGDTTIYVGSYVNLPIVASNWPSLTSFLLRSPYEFNSGKVLKAWAGHVEVANVNELQEVVPAFNLNLSSVIFASAASAAASDGALTTPSALTLRYDANGALGGAAYNSSKVTVSGAPSGTYLVVQNDSGAWAKAVSGNATFLADEIDSSLTSLENCEVWLETTNATERITTATRAIAAAGSYTAAAGADTLTPVVGDDDAITLTVKEILGNTDSDFNGAKDVTITGVEAAPDGTYGSFNGTALDADSAGAGQVISVTFTDGVATANLKLNSADAQAIGFSIATVTTPATNTLTITPTHGTAASMAVTQDITAPADNGGNFAQQPRITIKDAYGNTCTGDNTTVVTAAKEDAGAWTLTGTITATASSGVATFTNLGATNIALVNNAQLGFTAPGRVKVTSGMVTLLDSSPGITQFATKAELQSGFGLNTGNTVGKIKFGASGREWLIAGSDGADTIALLSASSFGTSKYNNDLSTYGDDNDSSLTSTVKTFLSNRENTTYFSNSELALMKNTTVSTKDYTGVSHNVTGKLYLPDAAGINRNYDTTIYVGSSNNIPITLSNWPYVIFWLRSPYTLSGNGSALMAYYSTNVFNQTVNSNANVVPAFDMDLSSLRLLRQQPHLMAP